MPSPSATKASDKQKALKKLTALLHKDYGKKVPSFDMPVLETMLFAACLEDNSWEAAEHGFDRLNRMFYDLNEVRVSSVAEIEEVLSDMRRADWAGLRIRSILRFVFESTYTYDYEKLKRLTQDSAQKRLKKIDHITPFIRNFTVQHCLGGYLVALDTSATQAAIHLGLVPVGSGEDQAGEFLKAGLKKAETFAFTCALRCLATDPKYIDRLTDEPDEDEEFDVLMVETRFADMKKPRRRRKKKKVAPPKKATAARSAAKKKAGTKSSAASAKSAKKKATSSGKAAATKKKTAAAKKKAAGKKVAVKKKAATKKKATKKVSARKKTAAAKKKKSASAKKKPAARGKTTKSKAARKKK